MRRACLALVTVFVVLASGCSDDAGASEGADSGMLPSSPCEDAEAHTGEATYYDADGSGNCSFPASPGDLMVAAMNEVDYAGSAACGACVELTGPAGSVQVRIVDRCPECPVGDIDLSPEAFAAIAALEQGRVAIEWRYVPCSVSGPIEYQFKDGSNQWWTAVQIRNHRHAIARFEVEIDGAWVEVPRESYNYFVLETGMGPGPYKFRVTDVEGGVVEDEGVPLLDAAGAPGASQFPACGG